MTTTKSGVCPKCCGQKVLRAFMHIDNGRCFTCGGAGTIEIRNVQAPVMPVVESDPAFELRRFYSCARSWVLDQGDIDWWKPASDYDVTDAIAFWLGIADASIATKARAAFVELLGAEFATYLTRCEMRRAKKAVAA